MKFTPKQIQNYLHVNTNCCHAASVLAKAQHDLAVANEARAKFLTELLGDGHGFCIGDSACRETIGNLRCVYSSAGDNGHQGWWTCIFCGSPKDGD